jgi:hypothetical protein
LTIQLNSSSTIAWLLCQVRFHVPAAIPVRLILEIGIVFVLMAIRMDAVREEATAMPASASLMPDWLLPVQEVELKLSFEQDQRKPPTNTGRSEGESMVGS